MSKKIKFIICILVISVAIIIALFMVKIFNSKVQPSKSLQTIYFPEVGKKRKKSIAVEIPSIYERANNNTKISDTITVKYSQADVSNYIWYGCKIEDVDRHFPIECLRKVGDKYYSIHLLKEGGVFYILYAYDTKLKTFIVRDFWLYDYPIYKKQFDNIVRGKSTFNDTHEINSTSAAIFSDSGTFSLHKTIDGYYIAIEYYGNKNCLVVSEKQTYKFIQNSIFTYLLPMDTPPNFGG